MNDRSPIAGNFDKTRIVSVPRNQWQAQRHNGSKGTIVNDPWDDIGSPCSKEDALRVIGGRAS